MENIQKELEELFFADALDKCARLNDLFQHLKKNTADKKTTHHLSFCLEKLKTNATEMSYPQIASLSGSMEMIFKNIEKDNLSISERYYQKLFNAKSVLSNMILSLKNPSIKMDTTIVSELESDNIYYNYAG